MDQLCSISALRQASTGKCHMFAYYSTDLPKTGGIVSPDTLKWKSQNDTDSMDVKHDRNLGVPVDKLISISHTDNVEGRTVSHVWYKP